MKIRTWTLAILAVAATVPNTGLGQDCGTPLLRVSDAWSGEQGNHNAWPGYPSSGGRFVAFESVATNILPGDEPGTHDIFWRDLETGELLLVNVTLDGGFPGRQSKLGQVDCEGYSVVFSSAATDLVENDTNAVWDIFVRDMDQGITTRVNVSSDGEQANSSSDTPRISGNGRYAGFASSATNLVPNDTNGKWDAFVHDRWTGETIRVSVSSTGEQANRGCSGGNPSYDGHYAVFATSSSNLVPDDTNGEVDIFVHDLWIGETTRVSIAWDGQEGNDGCYVPRISGDGSVVAFESAATNLVPDDNNGTQDIFVVEWQSDPPVIERVNVSAEGEEANAFSERTRLSSVGRYAAFMSFATNLVPQGARGWGDIYVHDRLTGETTMVSTTVTGEWAEDWSIKPQIACDGEFVTFTTPASDHVPGDNNGFFDLYLRALEVDLLTSGDGDCDGDIDFADFAVMQRCFTGDAPNDPFIGPECYALDFDFDGHVGLDDVADYLNTFTGPQ